MADLHVVRDPSGESMLDLESWVMHPAQAAYELDQRLSDFMSEGGLRDQAADSPERVAAIDSILDLFDASLGDRMADFSVYAGEVASFIDNHPEFCQIAGLQNHSNAPGDEESSSAHVRKPPVAGRRNLEPPKPQDVVPLEDDNEVYAYVVHSDILTAIDALNKMRRRAIDDRLITGQEAEVGERMRLMTEALVKLGEGTFEECNEVVVSRYSSLIKPGRENNPIPVVAEEYVPPVAVAVTVPRIPEKGLSPSHTPLIRDRPLLRPAEQVEPFTTEPKPAPVAAGMGQEVLGKAGNLNKADGQPESVLPPKSTKKRRRLAVAFAAVKATFTPRKPAHAINRQKLNPYQPIEHHAKPLHAKKPIRSAIKVYATKLSNLVHSDKDNNKQPRGLRARIESHIPQGLQNKISSFKKRREQYVYEVKYGDRRSIGKTVGGVALLSLALYAGIRSNNNGEEQASRTPRPTAASPAPETLSTIPLPTATTIPEATAPSDDAATKTPGNPSAQETPAPAIEYHIVKLTPGLTPEEAAVRQMARIGFPKGKDGKFRLKDVRNFTDRALMISGVTRADAYNLPIDFELKVPNTRR